MVVVNNHLPDLFQAVQKVATVSNSFLKVTRWVFHKENIFTPQDMTFW